MQKGDKTDGMLPAPLTNSPLEGIWRGSVWVANLLIALLLAVNHALAANPTYSVKDLGTIGGDSSEAIGINDSCQITGWSLNGSGHKYAFLYKNGKMAGLGSLGSESLGSGINNSGQITGTTQTANGKLRAFRYITSMNNLGTLGSLSMGFGINNSGYVVGITGTSLGHRAFLYNGQMIDLGTLPDGTYSQGYGINDSGVVTGIADTPAGEQHAFVYKNGMMIDLGTLPGGMLSFGRAINNSGQVTGYSETNDGNRHAFLFTNGQMIDLGTIGGYTHSDGIGINSKGQVVGRLTDEASNEHGFFHDGASMYDLNALIPQGSGWVLARANAINSNGQIVGAGTFNGATRAFLLNRTHELTSSATSGGTISPSGTVMVEEGQTQVYTITPDAYYKVVSVLVDEVEVGPASGYTFDKITGPHTISVTFAKITHFISASSGPNGSIQPSGKVEVEHGGRQTFTITPAPNHHVASVVVDGIPRGVTNSYTLYEIGTDHTIHANFAPNQYSITASAGPNGSISPSGSLMVSYGADQTFTIKPDTNFEIADVVVDGKSVGPVAEYTFDKVVSEHTILASFALKRFTIAASAGSNGSISPAGQVLVPFGTDQAFNIKAAKNYHIEDVKINNVSMGPLSTYTFTKVDTSHSISAVFAKNLPHTITVSATANGTINPSGSVKVNYGAKKEFTIIPNAKYRIKKIFLDGTPVAITNPLVLKNVVENHDLVVTFEKINRRPVPDAGPNQDVPSGSLVCLSATNSTDPDDGIASYLWKQIDGPPVDLAPLSSPTPSFVAPETGFKGASLSFQVTVTDRSGQKSAGSCIVNVLKTNGKVPPVANAGPDQVASQEVETPLDGSASSNSGQGKMSYKWTLVSGPVVTIMNAKTSRASFIAPTVPLGGEQPFFRLLVTSPSGLRSADTCIANVTSTNLPPTADAGPDQDNIHFGDTVTLDGMSSSDPEGLLDTYRWRQVSGRPVTLANPAAAQTFFTAPDTPGELVFELTVTDSINLKTRSTCIVRVTGS